MVERAHNRVVPARLQRAGIAVGLLLVFALLIPVGQTLARFSDSATLSANQQLTTGSLAIDAVPGSLQAELRSYQNAPRSATRHFQGGVQCEAGAGPVAYTCAFNEAQLKHLVLSGGDEVEVSQRLVISGEGKNLRVALALTVDRTHLPTGVALSDISLYHTDAAGNLGALAATLSATQPQVTLNNIDKDDHYTLRYTLNTFNTRCPETGPCPYVGQTGSLPTITATVTQKNR